MSVRIFTAAGVLFVVLALFFLGKSDAVASKGFSMLEVEKQVITIDPKPKFDLSPYLYMQFMEPLGSTDGSVEAGWDFLHNRWRPDLIDAIRELAPILIRWGGCLSSYYRWKEAVGPRSNRVPMHNILWGGMETNQVGVHNRVQNIAAMADFLRNLVPEAKVAVGHGQMAEKELEQVMLDFMEGTTNVLVCSTIIENGLDIPRANTMIVNRADCFGLAQLYQLRGRVGRSDRRAYAYLLIPGEAGLTREARERLRVLQELTELGAGFRIASHDLELRGAGDLLGANQSGQIAAIGFEMYTELLEETIHELKGLAQQEKVDPEIRLGLSAFLPEKYIPDPNQRLVLYKKLAAAADEGVVYAVADELRDRFGELPPEAELLLEIMKLRVLLKELKIESAEYDGRRLVFAFHRETPVPPEAILQLLADKSGRYQFSPDYRLTIAGGKLERDELIPLVKKELHGIMGRDKK